MSVLLFPTPQRVMAGIEQSIARDTQRREEAHERAELVDIAVDYLISSRPISVMQLLLEEIDALDRTKVAAYIDALQCENAISKQTLTALNAEAFARVKLRIKAGEI